MRYSLALVLLFLFVGKLFSQTEVVNNDSARDIDPEFVEWMNRVDSLVNSNYVLRNDTLEFGEIVPDSIIRVVSDSIYMQRIDSINSIVDLAFNDPVKRNLDFYINRAYRQIPRLLALSSYYFPMFDKIFDEYGIPNELKYLSVIESALNPQAVSRVGATGLWQFMYSTGKMMGLEINSYVDERRDPYMSTHAACKYLSSLYEVYDDWILVLAAYNCGPGNVNRAIRRAGGKNNFWEIYYYLPRETRNYVPAYIAVNYLFNYYDEHGFIAAPIDVPGPVDTVMITHDMHFDQLAACMNIKKSELRFLNPQYKKDFIPAKNKPRHLLLPIELIDDYIAIEDTVYLYKDSIYLNSKSLTYKPSESSPGNYAPATQPSGSEKLLYTIKSGDAVGLIASWYGVGIAELKAWNGMYSNNIRAGKKLVVYVPKEKLNYYSVVDNLSKAAKQKRNGINPDSGKKIQAPLDANYEYYTVKSGDSPWIIANKFPGISVNEILKLNGITNASSLQVGQKIKIRKKI